MTTSKEEPKRTALKLSSTGRLELKKSKAAPVGRNAAPSVSVEMKRKLAPGKSASAPTNRPDAPASLQIKRPAATNSAAHDSGPNYRAKPNTAPGQSAGLSNSEREARMRALEMAKIAAEARRVEEEQRAKEAAERQAAEREQAERLAAEKAQLESQMAEVDKKRASEEALRRKAEEEARKKLEAEDAARKASRGATDNKRKPMERPAPPKSRQGGEDFLAGGRIKNKKSAPYRDSDKNAKTDRRATSKLTVNAALTGNEDRQRSLASLKRRREKEKLASEASRQENRKVIRDVVIVDTMTVQDLANRMAERGSDVVKTLMKMGVMATINQVIDSDTAELVVSEFGHRFTRISDEDIEDSLVAAADDEGSLVTRPPVVTIMGHVDHGKTSLLDALRKTNVVGGEAGGITQHIGAYQIEVAGGQKITFLDTPGHAAFTQMRARGADATDIVILVVAADDGIMPQTKEAIAHAKAADVPIIVAVNKIDKPGADPSRIETDLLQEDMVVESMGGEVIAVPVSATRGDGLDTLLENILLQAEVLELKANPEANPRGIVVEAKLEKGRGSVGTVLVQNGTLKVGDVFVSGSEWGRVRALFNDQGKMIKSAPPALPVEVLGLSGTPSAGDDLIVVEDEGRAREIADSRKARAMEKKQALSNRSTLEQMFSAIQEGAAKELPIVIKGDVQGSVEAIVSSLEKMSTDEVRVRVLHSGVGAITESDITLSGASEGLVIGFNTRANPQARDQAKQQGVDIRYFSIIYQLLDDIKDLLSGMLAPEMRENFLGYAEIREVFNITKTGKVAGCYITEGVVKRGSGVRLLRDNVVIHEGKLKTLRRFKEEVKEVSNNYECGMAFEGYQDLQVGDQIECFEVEAIARSL